MLSELYYDYYFTFILGMVTVGDCNLALTRQPEEFARRLLVTGIAAFPTGPATKSHLSASITTMISFVATGLYRRSAFTLKTVAYRNS